MEIFARWHQGDVHKTEEKEDFWRKAYQVAQRHICTTPKSFILTSHIGMAFADVEMTWDIFKYNIQEKDKKSEVKSHEDLEWKQNKSNVRCLRTKPTWI